MTDTLESLREERKQLSKEAAKGNFYASMHADKPSILDRYDAALEAVERESINRGVRLTYIGLAAGSMLHELEHMFGINIPGGTFAEAWKALDEELQKFGNPETRPDLKAHVAALRAALEPFMRIIGTISVKEGAEWGVFLAPPSKYSAPAFTIADVERARRVLEETKP